MANQCAIIRDPPTPHQARKIWTYKLASFRSFKNGINIYPSVIKFNALHRPGLFRYADVISSIRDPNQINLLELQRILLCSFICDPNQVNLLKLQRILLC